MKRVFVVAMADEAAGLLALLTQSESRVLYGRRVISGCLKGESTAVVISGIGKSHAAAATQLALSLLTQPAGEVVNFGLCGGFGSSVELGGLYEVAAAVEYDFDLSEVNGTAKGVLDGRKDAYLPLAVTGRWPARVLATGDRFCDDESDHLFLTQTLGASLRDMEGAALAHVCETAGVRCRALKCVSDVAGCGGMTGQYLANRAFCLEKLAQAVATYV